MWHAVVACGCRGIGEAGPEREQGSNVKGDSAGAETTGIHSEVYSVNRYGVATWRCVGAFAVAGACGVAGLVAREGAHGGLFQVDTRAFCGSESRA